MYTFVLSIQWYEPASKMSHDTLSNVNHTIWFDNAGRRSLFLEYMISISHSSVNWKESMMKYPGFRLNASQMWPTAANQYHFHPAALFCYWGEAFNIGLPWFHRGLVKCGRNVIWAGLKDIMVWAHCIMYTWNWGMGQDFVIHMNVYIKRFKLSWNSRRTLHDSHERSGLLRVNVYLGPYWCISYTYQCNSVPQCTYKPCYTDDNCSNMGSTERT